MTETLLIKPVAITTNGNVRFNPGDLTKLKASIDRIGIIQPLVVRKDGEVYVLVAGHRRHQAAVELGLEVVPVVVTEVVTDEATRIEAQLAENIFRDDLTPLEKAQAVLDLKEEGYTQKNVAAATGYTQKQVSAYQKVGRAIAASEQAIELGDVSEQQLLSFVEDADESAIAEVLTEWSIQRPDHWGNLNDLDEVYSDWKAARVVKVATEAAQAALKAFLDSGVKVFDELDPSDLKGMIVVDSASQDKWESWQLQSTYKLIVDLDAHLKLECHQIMVYQATEWRGMALEHQCTDPQTHVGKKATLKALNKVSPAEANKSVADTKEKGQRTRIWNKFFRKSAAAWASESKLNAAETKELTIELLRLALPYGYETRTAKLMGLEVAKDGTPQQAVAEFIASRGKNGELEALVMLHLASSIEQQQTQSYGSHVALSKTLRDMFAATADVLTDTEIAAKAQEKE